MICMTKSLPMKRRVGIYEAYKTGTHCSHMNNGSSFGAQLLLTVDTLSPTPDTSIHNPSAVTPT
jgi:hypothetical protein